MRAAVRNTLFSQRQPVRRMHVSALTPAWQNTTRTTAVSLDNDPARVIDDISSYNLHWIASSDARRALYKTNIQSARPMFLFDGVDDHYIAGTANDWKFLVDGSSWVIHWVFKTTSQDPNAALTLCGNNSGSNSNIGVNVRLDDQNTSTSGSDSIKVDVTRGVGGAPVASFTSRPGACSSGDAHVLSILFTPGTGMYHLKVYADAEFIGGAMIANPFPSGSPQGAMYFGARGTTPTLYYSGYMGEVSFWSGAVSEVWLLSNATRLIREWVIPDLATLTAQSRATLIADEDVTVPYYNHTAFPSSCVAPNGDVLLVFMRDTGHNSPNGTTVLRRIVGGVLNSYASEVLLYSPTGSGETLLRYVPDGIFTIGTRVWFVYHTLNNAGERTPYLQYSDDSGNTWGAAWSLGNLGHSSNSVVGSDLRASAVDGKLLLSVWAVNSGDAGYTSELWVSDGTTSTTSSSSIWTKRGTIATGAGIQYEEPRFNYLDDGRLMCLMRVDGDRTIRRSYSSDDGATWTTQGRVLGGFGVPRWVQTTNGLIVMATRFYDPLTDDTPLDYKCYGVYSVSRNRGLTWQQERALNPNRKWYSDSAALWETSANVVSVVHAQASPDDSAKCYLDYLELIAA